MSTHKSNPNNPKDPFYQPDQIRLVIEDGKKTFKKEHLFRQVRDLLFLMRDNPALTAEFFNFVQEQPSDNYEKRIGTRSHLKIDPSVVEQIAQLLLDNPFPDTSKTHHTNLLFFNTLKAFYLMLNTKSQSLKVNNNILTREQLRNHISCQIFGTLIKSMEAQSYLRFIYKSIFSKINLIQLIAFINEKEAVKQGGAPVPGAKPNEGDGGVPLPKQGMGVGGQ